MALNLVRNSRVFFTTNVNSSTGIINSSGFDSSNTQELQVLEGFSFSQNTNSTQITVSEAGVAPIRGQRSFNTSLAPVDFSLSTYIRPFNSGSNITAEESLLWNALLSSTATTTSYSIGGITGLTYTTSLASGSSTAGVATVTISGTTLTGYASLKTDDIITLTGLVTSTASDSQWLNAPGKVVTSTSTSITLTMVNPKPQMASLSTITVPTSLTAYKCAWVPATSSYSLASSAGSNVNRLQVFGLIFIVDNVTYLVDNAVMNQAMIDFGLDAIATIQWTGQATKLRQSTTINLSGGGISVSSTTVSGILSTDNLFFGQTVVASGGTGALAANSTIAQVGTNSITLSTNATTNGTLTGVKIVVNNTSGTLAAPSGTGPWVSNLTGLSSVSGVSAGDVITATGTYWGSDTTAVVTKILSSSSLEVTFTPVTDKAGVAPTAGSVSAIIITIANLTSTTTLTSAAKQPLAQFITNKLSTVTLKTLNALGSAAAKEYSLALTGGSITINNNVTYITPANLGIVNVPNTYYTGTRAITGSLTAYLKTGTGVGSTGQLLSDMLDAASASVEPMAQLSVAIGGKDNATKVILDLPSVTLSVPTIDAGQPIISTTINFTGQGYIPSSTTDSNTFDVNALNDFSVRYYAASA